MDQGTEAEARRARRRRRLAILAVLLGTSGALFHRFLFLDNLAIVERGRVYRSAQLKGRLESTLEANGIATVLNLRGGSRADWWYAQEVDVTRRLGIDFYDLPLEADERPSRRELVAIVDLLDRCRYPLLVHCKSGSDRTGLVSALYRLVERGEPPERARTSFSLWRGHVPLFGPERLHAPLVEYQAWLAAERLPHTPDRFRGWLAGVYRSGREATAERLVPARLEPGPRAELALRAGRRLPR
jgi:protein tyrosine phosphatase (PTP) superfamily phosphohydrolase (DUF442 family)